MPGKVKVKIIAGRNLPVMDRGSDTTDAYVEVKLGSTTQKTDVCRKSLNPRWNNSDWFRFEMDDHELQDEPLQIRLMDYDTYSANDAIGKVNISLNPLLNSALDSSQKSTNFSSGKGTMSGWLPVFDTMNGIRGEVEILVKVDLFTDVNKFRQSSCGVQFFHSLNIPFGYHVPTINGFVEELIVNDDPEYQWIDKVRTPRASNEARQVLFLKLSSQVQRKIGLKASEMGANAVIGYRLCLDLEGDVGVVARGIGTAVTLMKIPDSIHTFTENVLIEENESNSSSTIIAADSKATSNDDTLPPSPIPPSGTPKVTDSKQIPISPQTNPPINIVPETPENNAICRRSSDSDLSVTPKGNSVTSCERTPAPTIHRSITGHGPMKSTVNTLNLDMLEYPFLTLEKFPPGFIIHLGSCVCARSVKLLERVANPDEPETRDCFWTELRMEIRSHARALGCNVVLGYSESTTICDDVCVFSATGTAAVINVQYIAELGLADSTGNLAATKMTSSLDRNDFERTGGGSGGGDVNKGSNGKVDGDALNTGGGGGGGVPDSHPSAFCGVAHIPYNLNSVPFNVSMDTCFLCRKTKVPDVLVATIEVPDNLSITGRGCLIQAQVCRVKKDLKGESNAKEVSDALPFLEYELHRLLINKLKVKGMNSIFGLKSTLAVGEKLITLIATGTGVYVSALPPAVLPKVVGAKQWPDPEKIKDIQRTLTKTMEKNMEIYQVSTGWGSDGQNVDKKTPTSVVQARNDNEESEEEGSGKMVAKPSTTNSGETMDLTLNNKDICILEVDDIDDLEVLTLLMEPSPPEGFFIVNTQSVPGLPDSESVQQQQYFVQMWRGKFTSNHIQNQFAKSLQKLLQGIIYKLRTMTPCAISDLRFTVDLPDNEWVQVLITGMATKVDAAKTRRRRLQSVNRDKSKKDEELIFNLEEDHHHDQELSSSMNNLSPHILAGGGGMGGKHQTSLPTNSMRHRNKSPVRNNPKSKFPRPTFPRARYGVDITPMGFVPGARMERYLGNLNFFFIRESTSIRESGGVCGFVHSFITEVLALIRAHVTALGGNAMVAFYMTEMTLNESIHKNQGQCLISVGGDVVSVSYPAEE